MALGSRKKTQGESPSQTTETVLERKARGVDRKKDVSGRHEALTAKALGGSVQRASGATPRHKGDVSTVDLLIENKTRLPESGDGAKSIRIQGSWLVKITGEARAVGKDPALAFEIPNGIDTLTERRWIALPETVLQRLLEEARAPR